MKRILVIEDDPTSMLLFASILESGYEVIEATSGKEGIKLAIKEKPDLILLDIQLPDIDGLEAMKRIRKSRIAKEIPVVAITSYVMAGDREKILNAGCKGYIEKPIKVLEFIGEIEKYL